MVAVVWDGTELEEPLLGGCPGAGQDCTWSGGVLLHRDTKVIPEAGVERVLQLPGVNCFSG